MGVVVAAGRPRAELLATGTLMGSVAKSDVVKFWKVASVALVR